MEEGIEARREVGQRRVKRFGFGGDEGAEGFGLRSLVNWCASSSQCRGLELLLDGIFSPVASAVPASIWRDAACSAKSQPASDTAIKSSPWASQRH